jgi:hypothetical protein
MFPLTSVLRQVGRILPPFILGSVERLVIISPFSLIKEKIDEK